MSFRMKEIIYEFSLNLKYENNTLSSAHKKILRYYLSNADGKSCQRLRKFLDKAIN